MLKLCKMMFQILQITNTTYKIVCNIIYIVYMTGNVNKYIINN
jgi:hypothetical protein